MPFFSVIIPTYNRLPYLLEALESVARQSFRDYEVIVVDDGSQDGTEQAVLEMLKCEKLKAETLKEDGTTNDTNHTNFLTTDDAELFLRVLRNGTCSYNPAVDWCYQVGTPNNVSSHRVRNERCMLEVLLGCEPYYYGEMLKPAIAKSANRTMAVALMDGSPQERRRAYNLAWDRLSVSGKFFFGLSAVVPSLGRGLLWMKRKLRPVR